MALENISNVPEVCSGMLRIAPRAHHIQNFLEGDIFLYEMTKTYCNNF